METSKMGFLKFIRGLFTKPTQKRVKALKTKETIKYIGIWERPPVGRLSYHDSERIVNEMSKYMNNKEVAKKLNKMGYMTPRGRKWNESSVFYWSLLEDNRQKRRERCKKYDYEQRHKNSNNPSLGQRMNYAQQQNGVN
jgi:hypothetical protein